MSEHKGLSLELELGSFSAPLVLGQQQASGGGLDEAPVNNRIYGRQNRGWVDISRELEEIQEQLDELPDGYDDLIIDIAAIQQAIKDLNLLYGDTVSASLAARDAIAAKADAILARAEAILAGEEAGEAAIEARNHRLAVEIAADGIAQTAEAVIESETTVAGYVTAAESAALVAQTYAQSAQVAEEGASTVVQAILDSESITLAYKNAAESAASVSQTNRQVAETAAAQANSEATRSTQAATQASGASSAAVYAAELAEAQATYAGTYANAAQGHASNSEASASESANRAYAANAAQLAAEAARDSAVGAAQATVTTASTVEALVTDTQALVQAASQSATQAATKASEAGTYASQASSAATTAQNHASASAQNYNAIYAIVGDPSNPAAGTLSAAVEQISSVVANWNGQLEAEHILAVNAAGVVTGFRLRASPTESSMLFAADNFQFWTQQGTFNPFTLDGNQIRFNGKVDFGNILNPPDYSGDSTKTVIDGGLITTGTIQLQDGGGTTLAGMSAAGDGPTSVRFWAGASYGNRQSAPYRVTQEGKLYALDGEFSGNINGSMITGGVFRTSLTGQRIEINQDNNEFRLIGDRGDGVLQTLVSIGVDAGLGQPSSIARFGSNQSNRSGVVTQTGSDSYSALYAQAAGLAPAILARQSSTHADRPAIDAMSNAGIGILTQGAVAPLVLRPSTSASEPTHSAPFGALWVTNAGVLWIRTQSEWQKVGGQ